MAKRFSIEADLEVSTNHEKPALRPMDVVFNGDKFRVDLNQEFKIDPYNLVDSMTQHSANYGWWAAVLAMSRTRLRRKKAEYTQRAAAEDPKIRQALVEAGFKVTEAAVQAGLEAAPELQLILSEDVVPLEEFVEYGELILKSFENKRDMLKEINRAQTSDRINS